MAKTIYALLASLITLAQANSTSPAAIRVNIVESPQPYVNQSSHVPHEVVAPLTNLVEADESRDGISLLIEREADARGYSVDKAKAIAWFESKYKNVCNTGGCVYGRGIFQIVQSTFDHFNCPGSPHVVEDNVKCALKILDESGDHHWRPYSGDKWVPVVEGWQKKRSDELKKEAADLVGQHGGQCVDFVKRFYGWPKSCDAWGCKPLGAAEDIKANLTSPEVGAIVLLHEGPKGHAAIVIGYNGAEIELAESNYKFDQKITVGRKLFVWDQRIRGYAKLGQNIP